MQPARHLRNWSYAILEREVRANLVYRQFTRVGAQKVPDAKTLGKLGLALGPEIIDQIHQRVIAIAREKKIVQGRRLRGKRPGNTVWTDRGCPEMIAGWMRLENVHDCDHGHNHSTDHCGC